ncbi:NUDIX domain-containing protein [Patescibacteria group bacterium]
MIKSAGIILLSISHKKILLVLHKDGHWGFSKGRVEKNENLKNAALRELKEETNMEPNAIFDKIFFRERYSFEKNNKKIHKEVSYFLGITCDLNIKVNADELLNAKWFTFDEIKKLKNFPAKKSLIKIKKIITPDNIKINITSRKNENNQRKQIIQGSKHLYSRVAPLLLLNKKIKFYEVPKTIDTAIINEVINITKNKKSDDEIIIPRKICELSRSVISIIPAILYRHKSITFYQPQGCSIGERKIDLYLQIMKKFGVKIIKKNNIIKILRNNLKNTTIKLKFPSFTGTSTALLMASMVGQKSIIKNISIEPEILEMISCLQKIGVKIKFLSERSVEVYCKKIFDKPKKIIVSEDRNVLVTTIMMALIQEQPFSYSSKNALYLSPLVEVFKKMGVLFYSTQHSFILKKNYLANLKPVEIIAGHFPNFCSDWQPLIAPILCKIKGKSTIKDTVFEKRYNYIKEIYKINPSFTYQIQNGMLVIFGDKVKKKAKSKSITKVSCLDIRSGAANIIAALGEKQITEIYNIQQIFRGYENIVKDVNSVSQKRASFLHNI